MLSFVLLGQFTLYKDGNLLSPFRSQKEAILLVYLAHTQESISREFLAELLWEKSSTKQALTNLRTALTRLRKQTGPALAITRKSVAVNSEQVMPPDSIQLIDSLETIGIVDSAGKADKLIKVLNLYQGDFLADFYLPSAPQINEWVMVTREQIRRQVTAAYNKLVKYLLSVGDYEQGISVTERWLKVDELDELAHTLLLRQLLLAGETGRATAHYNYSANLLRTELGVEPPKQMQALMEEVNKPATVYVRTSIAVQHNFPTPYDQFFGRMVAQQEIHTRLDQPWCRLVTLVGQGGIGKTRLATTIGRNRSARYRDGAWLVELADIEADHKDRAEEIAVEIATILNLRLTGSAKPVEQLLSHLQYRESLLVLDNFEHLLEGGIELVLEIVQRCDKVQLMVTSREALNIRPEWAISLTGLSYPTSDSDTTPSDAVELFIARKAQQTGGELEATELNTIRTICHMIEGLPLAIELAAALTGQMSLDMIVDHLHEGLDILASSQRDIPERHRSLDIVFEMSWETLSPNLQDRLAKLAVFRGGFALEAAKQIVGGKLSDLKALQDKSLLRYHQGSKRYSLHPVIQAYAADKRPFADKTEQSHSLYYLDLLAQHVEPLQQDAPQRSMAVLGPEIENIRLGWQTGLTHGRSAELLTALPALSVYYQLRGLAYEGESVMQATGKASATWGEDGIPLTVYAGLEQARFQNRLGRQRKAIRTLQKVLKLAKGQKDNWGEGMGAIWWGEALWRLGEYDGAKEKLAYALKIGRGLEDESIIGWCHHQFGIVHDIQSQHTDALNDLEKACGIWRELDHAQNLSNSLNSLGLVYYNRGDLAAAKAAMEQALYLCDQLGNRHVQQALLNNLSMIATDQDDYIGALYYLQLGLQLAQANGDTMRQGEIYPNLGRVYHLMGEIDLASESLEKGIEMLSLIGNRPNTALAMLRLASVRQEQKRTKEAEQFFEQALVIAQQDNLKNIECQILLGLAKFFIVNDIGNAKETYMQARSIAEKLQNPRLLAESITIERALQID